jgi:hypothetical protein
MSREESKIYFFIIQFKTQKKVFFVAVIYLVEVVIEVVTDCD